MRVVFDTNLLVSALRSSTGASNALLQAMPTKKFQTVVSVPLYFEYQAVLNRPGLLPPAVTSEDIKDTCTFVLSVSEQQEIFYLWRPFLPDSKDDMVLELAIASGAKYIVTHNTADFHQAPQLGVKAVKPGDFIKVIGGLP